MAIINGDNGNNTLIGTDGDDQINGFGGNDLIDGRFGFDLMDGGDGNDTTTYAFYFGGINANLQTGVVSFPGNSPGTDTLLNIENVIGSGGNDVITGDGFDNNLFGGAGDDLLDGSFGFDYLDGGDGNDTATYAFYSGGINANLQTGVVSFPGNGTLTDTLVNIENVIGSNGNDVITGDGFDNNLFGGAGDDLLDGSFGFDYLDGGDGNDTATYAFYFGGINANLQTGVVSFPGTGDRTDTLVNIENVIGSNGNDTIIGDGFDNNLFGGAGDDLLDGSFGFDYLDGGDGNDTVTYSFYFGGINANLQTGVVSFPGTGDRTDSLVNIENLIGSGGNDIITGTPNGNTLEGGQGNDTIDGKAGNDILIGGSGDDVYTVSDAGDQVREILNEGVDTIAASLSFTLPNNVERLALLGTANINATGNAIDNVLLGNTGANVLTGGAGNDILIGNAGRDALKGGTGADRFTFVSPQDGIDRIAGFSRPQGDKVVFLSSGFGNLPAGAVPADQFVAGTRAKDSNDRFIYDVTTSSLFYDADGRGGVGQVKIATFDNQPTLAATDLLIVTAAF